MALNFKAGLTLLSALCLTPVGAMAHDMGTTNSDAEITEGLRAFFASQDKANRDGLSTTELVKRFYAEDVIITGEGDAVPRRGIKDAVTALDDWFAYLGPNGNKGCEFSVQDSLVASGDLASVFAVLKCKPTPKTKKEETIRQLFVLKRSPLGWRVVREMWQAGDFAK
ncbi:hypothetical protein [Sphingobium chungbukense]|nr:hypothetical protein [Sphingobium chungbukense]